MTRVSLQPNRLPVELRQFDQWVAWGTRHRDGKATKVPLDPAGTGVASTTDPSTWGSFDAALAAVREPTVSGIGFVFTDGDPYVGVDLDDCRVPETGTLTEPAASICARLDSYTEVSPSGTGIHVIARGRLPEGPRRRGTVEMYDDSRFFTMTGARIAETPTTVCERTAALEEVHDAHIGAPDVSTESRTDAPPTDTKRDTPGRRLSFDRELDDETLLRKATSAANGAKFTELWRGRIGRYDSHSEADMALCCLLAFWTGRNPARIDELFRQSGLMRPKWDEVHYADGATYGERTVERACTRVSDQYDGSVE